MKTKKRPRPQPQQSQPNQSNQQVASEQHETTSWTLALNKLLIFIREAPEIDILDDQERTESPPQRVEGPLQSMMSGETQVADQMNSYAEVPGDTLEQTLSTDPVVKYHF